jgi:hypothetical protein
MMMRKTDARYKKERLIWDRRDMDAYVNNPVFILNGYEGSVHLVTATNDPERRCKYKTRCGCLSNDIVKARLGWVTCKRCIDLTIKDILACKKEWKPSMPIVVNETKRSKFKDNKCVEHLRKNFGSVDAYCEMMQKYVDLQAGIIEHLNKTMDLIERRNPDLKIGLVGMNKLKDEDDFICCIDCKFNSRCDEWMSLVCKGLHYCFHDKSPCERCKILENNGDCKECRWFYEDKFELVDSFGMPGIMYSNNIGKMDGLKKVDSKPDWKAQRKINDVKRFFNHIYKEKSEKIRKNQIHFFKKGWERGWNAHIKCVAKFNINQPLEEVWNNDVDDWWGKDLKEGYWLAKPSYDDDEFTLVEITSSGDSWRGWDIESASSIVDLDKWEFGEYLGECEYEVMNDLIYRISELKKENEHLVNLKKTKLSVPNNIFDDDNGGCD